VDALDAVDGDILDEAGLDAADPLASRFDAALGRHAVLHDCPVLI